MGAWVPGRAVPGCLGRSPGPLGHILGGSQGGVPGPMSVPHLWPCLPWIRIKNYVDFGVDFWSSWGRSWVPLGVILGSCWRLFRPKWVPDPSSNRLIIEKVICHETLRFPTGFLLFLILRWGQDRPKIAPRRVQDRLGSLFWPLDFALRF